MKNSKFLIVGKNTVIDIRFDVLGANELERVSSLYNLGKVLIVNSNMCAKIECARIRTVPTHVSQRGESVVVN